jgi:hypothetical protein
VIEGVDGTRSPEMESHYLAGIEAEIEEVEAAGHSSCSSYRTVSSTFSWTASFTSYFVVKTHRITAF